jgi:hypothetical protein
MVQPGAAFLRRRPLPCADRAAGQKMGGILPEEDGPYCRVRRAGRHASGAEKDSPGVRLCKHRRTHRCTMRHITPQRDTPHRAHAHRTNAARTHPCSLACVRAETRVRALQTQQGLIQSCKDLVRNSSSDAQAASCTATTSPTAPECQAAFCKKLIANEDTHDDASSRISSPLPAAPPPPPPPPSPGHYRSATRQRNALCLTCLSEGSDGGSKACGC